MVKACALRTSRRFLRSALLAGLGFAAGCAVGPDYVPPEPEVPDAWHLELSRGIDGSSSDLRMWWKRFDDPVLDDLIDQAGGGNLDLRIAVARVLEARAVRGVARGEWFPTADAGGSATANQATDSLAALTSPDGGRSFESYELGLDASWEIDVFGRIRRSTESADANLMATVEDYRDVLVALYAEVARSYVELRTSQERLRLARSNAESQRGTLQLTVDRNRAGLSADLDVRQAELNLARTESFIPVLEEAVARNIHRLSVLIGAAPATLFTELDEPQPIPAVPSHVAVGLPANLLRQRPDVRSAERRLAAQTARIGVATADLYPRFSLVGSFALSAFDAAEFFTRGSTTYGVGPTMQWNVFDGGRIRNLIKVEDSRALGSLAEYEQTVLVALREVEDAIVAFEREFDRRDHLERSVRAAQESVDLVLTLYRTGLTDFQNVLDMERSLFTQQDEFARSEGVVVGNLVDLYRALGGGWDPDPSTSPTGGLPTGGTPAPLP